jgi:hypothetical protein
MLPPLYWSILLCQLWSFAIGTSAVNDVAPEAFRSSDRNPSEYERAKEQLVAARARKQPANLAAARSSLEEVIPYAQAAGIKLGLETRYYY